MSKLGIGIVGLRMGYGHFQQCKELKDADLVGICDLDADLVEKLSREFDVPVATTDLDELIASDQIDVVSITTPDYLHLEQTIKALEAGKHVLVEKPMARTVEECAEMVEVARKCDRKLMVAHVARFYQSFQDAHRWAFDGTLGDLYFVETSYIHNYEEIPGFDGWRFDPEKRHVLVGGGCHAIDLARWFGGDVIAVSALSNHFNIPAQKADDMWILNLQFDNDVIGRVTVSSGCQRPYNIDLEVWGTRGTLVGDNTSSSCKLSLRQVDRYRWMELPKPQEGKQLSKETEHFIDCIINDKTPLIDGVDGAKTVATAWAAIESSKQGGAPVKVRNDF